jgi:hypothetical protein
MRSIARLAVYVLPIVSRDALLRCLANTLVAAWPGTGAQHGRRSRISPGSVHPLVHGAMWASRSRPGERCAHDGETPER